MGKVKVKIDSWEPSKEEHKFKYPKKSPTPNTSDLVKAFKEGLKENLPEELR